MINLHRANSTILLVLVLALLSTACENGNKAASMAESSSVFAVGEVFENFYAQLGGEESLGPCISPVFTRGSVQYQYTVAALLVYDPNAPLVQRYRLWDIGNSLALEGAGKPQAGDPSLIDLGGYLIWEEVVPIYKKLGAQILGRPLTGLLFNRERGRYEQFFENAGFYRNWADAPGEVAWLPYGSWICAEKCPAPPGSEVIHIGLPPTPVALPPTGEINQAILAVAERLGSLYTGNRLSDAYQAADGLYEMVFENVVLFVEPQDLGQVRLRPLPSLVGIIPEPPVPQVLNVPGMRFYPVLGGDLGYNVPQYFVDFITLHSNFEFSGYPISEVHPKGQGSSYQCYQNLCLEYDANAPAEFRVRPSALGIEYWNRLATQLSEPQANTSRLSIQIWERYPLLTPGQEQEIHVLVLDGNRPLENVSTSLWVQYPDGVENEFLLPPTDVNGLSWLKLRPITASDGTVVPYQVCLLGLMEKAVCYSESFVIWSAP